MFEPFHELCAERLEHCEPFLGLLVERAEIRVHPGMHALHAETREADANETVPGLATDLEAGSLATRQRKDRLGDASLRLEHAELVVTHARHELRLDFSVVIDDFGIAPGPIERFQQDGVARSRELREELTDSYFFCGHIDPSVTI
ncbi:hypothetical protein [Polyangium sp. 6x1]|uniref:hypothetical protein n=1 Tax=Polyangium sp. 6x1 TaxID=3042689 RepID=UPI002482E264|nr:hypothetical protein [Polyangium sp. 6x1]MDI1450058.1 hypothetical protein [Polyangium sp. 6x1]